MYTSIKCSDELQVMSDGYKNTKAQGYFSFVPIALYFVGINSSLRTQHSALNTKALSVCGRRGLKFRGATAVHPHAPR